MARTTLLLTVLAILACNRHEAPPVASAHAPAAAPSPAAPPPATVSTSEPAPAPATLGPDSVERVPVAVAHARVQSGQALFVCAYEDDACAELALAGSIPWSALQTRLPGLARDQEIILFCD